jgi:hypothetical protein
VQLHESFPPAKVEQYAIRYGIPGQEAPMTPELKQLDTKARGWMVDSGLPVPLGNSLVNTFGKVVETTGKMSEAQLQHYGETEFVKLQGAWPRSRREAAISGADGGCTRQEDARAQKSPQNKRHWRQCAGRFRSDPASGTVGDHNRPVPG